jgi:hypothetical protein|tara:strand:+ start:783 stop:1382 length:600 start_codon:yes stop_codon:yes gene_type:complete
MKLTNLTPYYRRKIKTNLMNAYNMRTSKDVKEGLEWYPRAHDICAHIGKEYDFNSQSVAHALSALSPRNKWERNIIDTKNVLKAVNDGKGPDDVKVCTFNNNKVKAFEIARGTRTIDNVSPKTYSFVKNIAELDDTKVTIDVWHLRAGFGQTIESGLTPYRYKVIEDITLKCAHEVGLKGYEFQAIVWGIVRNKSINNN